VDKTLSYVSKYTKSRVYLEAFLNSFSNTYLAGLNSEVDEGLKIHNRSQSRALSLPVYYIRLAAHTATRCAQTGSQLFVLSYLNDVLVSKYFQSKKDEQSQFVELNI
jgi:hypothetical protein